MQTLAAKDRGFFGHPKGLAYLLGAQVGWAFAYYGLQISLTLYMTQVLLIGAIGLSRLIKSRPLSVDEVEVLPLKS